jgi:predicted enzyme involved in methoxymalonyl-ACP biosynthesis
MKRITLNELPKVITEDVFGILVEMALEVPKQTFDWRDISIYLSENNLELLMKILDRVDEHQKSLEQAKEDAKSEEQRRLEAEHNRVFYENLNPKAFYGNMGEPETPQEYKDKYGVWPPGYDEYGNKS